MGRANSRPAADRTAAVGAKGDARGGCAADAASQGNQCAQGDRSRRAGCRWRLGAERPAISARRCGAANGRFATKPAPCTRMQRTRQGVCPGPFTAHGTLVRTWQARGGRVSARAQDPPQPMLGGTHPRGTTEPGSVATAIRRLGVDPRQAARRIFQTRIEPGAGGHAGPAGEHARQWRRRAHEAPGARLLIVARRGRRNRRRDGRLWQRTAAWSLARRSALAGRRRAVDARHFSGGRCVRCAIGRRRRVVPSDRMRQPIAAGRKRLGRTCQIEAADQQHPRARHAAHAAPCHVNATS